MNQKWSCKTKMGGCGLHGVFVLQDVLRWFYHNEHWIVRSCQSRKVETTCGKYGLGVYYNFGLAKQTLAWVDWRLSEKMSRVPDSHLATRDDQIKRKRFKPQPIDTEVLRMGISTSLCKFMWGRKVRWSSWRIWGWVWRSSCKICLRKYLPCYKQKFSEGRTE